MARTRIPNALEMQEYKYGERSDAEKDALAAALRAEGRRSEAILLFDKRPEHPALAEELAWAVETGSSFHLISLRTMGVAVSDEQIRACAAAAASRARWADARACWMLLGDVEAVRRIEEHLPPALRPPPPDAEV